jgi:hypothetical protein
MLLLLNMLDHLLLSVVGNLIRHGLLLLHLGMWVQLPSQLTAKADD